MRGVVEFLVGWLAFNKIITNKHSATYSYDNDPSLSSHSSHSLWDNTRQNQLQQHEKLCSHYIKTIPTQDIECFLPQICNTLLLTDIDSATDFYKVFEKRLLYECKYSLTFGFRSLQVLKSLVSYSTSSDSKDFSFRNNKLRHLIKLVEIASKNGLNLSSRDHKLREDYFMEFSFFLERLSNLGMELKKSFRANQRNKNLRKSISLLNIMLMRKILTKGNEKLRNINLKLNDDSNYDISEMCKIFSHHCFQLCDYSLHFPLQRSNEKTLRILRFVESESEVLPSKDRCPFLLACEVLERPYLCDDNRLFIEPINFYNNPIQRVSSVQSISFQPQTNNANNINNDDDDDDDENDGSYESFNVISAGNSQDKGKFQFSDSFKSASSNKDNSIIVIEKPIKKKISHKKLEKFRKNHHLKDNHHYKKTSSRNLNEDKISEYLTNPNNSNNLNDKNKLPFSWRINLQSPSSHNINKYNNMKMIVHSQHVSKTNVRNKQYTFVKEKSEYDIKNEIKSYSPFGSLPGWNLKYFIVKSGEDLRKEVLAMQIIEYFQKLFKKEGIDIILKPYQILCTGSKCGLIEYVEQTLSIDKIKKSFKSTSYSYYSTAPSPGLFEYFHEVFGEGGLVHEMAVNNFVRSLAGYSLVTYILQIKDRHNGNILIDEEGCIIHIDFGFLLGVSPGSNMNFESAPFKLTKEYVKLMGGHSSRAFKHFKELFIEGFKALQGHVKELSAIIESFFGVGSRQAELLTRRLNLNEVDIARLIDESFDSWRTRHYDTYQYTRNGIQP